MCLHGQYNPKPKLSLPGEEIDEEEEEEDNEFETTFSVLGHPQGEPSPHPLVIPNFSNPCCRIFPPNFLSLVTSLSEEYDVPKEYVYMVMCGESEDFITMAENIIETPPGEPVEYSMPEPLKAAWKYLMDTGDPGVDGDAEEQAAQNENLIPMDYVHELLSPVRNQLIMRVTLLDYLRTLEDDVSKIEMENCDKENIPPPTPE